MLFLYVPCSTLAPSNSPVSYTSAPSSIPSSIPTNSPISPTLTPTTTPTSISTYVPTAAPTTCQPYVDMTQSCSTTQNQCNLYGPLYPGGYSNGGGCNNNGFTLNACGYSITTSLLGLLNSLVNLVFVTGNGLSLITSGLLATTCNTFIQLDASRYYSYSNSTVWPVANYWSSGLQLVVSGLDSNGALIRADFTIYGSNTKGSPGTPLCSGKSQLSGEYYDMDNSCVSAPSYKSYQYLSVQAGISGGSCPSGCKSMYMKRVAQPCNVPTNPNNNPSPPVTNQPSLASSANPTATPSSTPTTNPSATPTYLPTATPTYLPTAKPTATPTTAPTATPTYNPTTAMTCANYYNLKVTSSAGVCLFDGHLVIDVVTNLVLGVYHNNCPFTNLLAYQIPYSSAGQIYYAHMNSDGSFTNTDSGSAWDYDYNNMMHTSGNSFDCYGLFMYTCPCSGTNYPVSLSYASNSYQYKSAAPSGYAGPVTTTYSSYCTSAPTSTPTSIPTSTPTSTPTATPTSTPTTTPTAFPTATPTASPTATPTASPTATPTASPPATPAVLLPR